MTIKYCKKCGKDYADDIGKWILTYPPQLIEKKCERCGNKLFN